MSRFLGTIGLTRLEGGSMLLQDQQQEAYGMPINDYYRRTQRTSRDINNWETSWPLSRSLSGDRSSGYSLGDDCGETSYEPWNECHPGARGGKFILGRCVDENGDGISGAIVQGFRTSDDLYVGETTANSEGYYWFSTPYEGVGHYLVAYLDSGSDAFGTTVNTLIPTNVDGT